MISIIIPVYNGEKHIKKCLQNILKASIDDMEIIVINDGSFDATNEIMCEICNTNQSIVYHINHSNLGLGATRNIGVSLSSKEYLTFLDCDDYIIPESLKKALSLIKDNEILIAPILKLFPNKTKKIVDLHRTIDDKDTSFSKYIGRQYGSWSAASKIYKSSFIKNNNILFKENHLYEDVIFGMKAHFSSRNTIVTPNFFYIYTQGNNTITRTKKFTTQHIKSILQLHNDITSFFQNEKILETHRVAFNSAMTILVREHLPNLFRAYTEEKNKDAVKIMILKELREHNTVFKKSCLELIA